MSGTKIYFNDLIFYDHKKLPTSFKENLLSFNALLNKNCDNTRVEVEVKTAIFHTMVFEQIMLKPLFKKRVPITVFLDRPASE